MKNALAGIILMLGTHVCSSQVTTMDRYHPKIIIQQLQIDTCKILVMNPDGSFTPEQFIVYDTAGNEVENIRYFQDFTFRYFYHPNGLKSAEYMIPFGEPPYEKDTLIYNEKDSLVMRISYGADNKETRRYEYIYNENLLAEERYYLAGNLHVHYFSHYDEKGLLKKVERLFQGRKSIDLFEYDDNGNLTEFKSVTPDGEVSLIQQLSYNELNLRSEFEAFTPKYPNSTQIYKTFYFENGLINYEEYYSRIKNGDLNTATYEKTIYQYTYRKQ